MNRKRTTSFLLALAFCLSLLPQTAFAEDVASPIAKKFVSVEMGFECCAAITEDGDLYMWGANDYGQLGVGDYVDRVLPTKVEGLSHVVKVSLRLCHSAAVTSDGRLYNWGRGPGVNSSTPRIVDLSDVVSVSIGDTFCAAVTKSGGLYVWGYNYEGQLGLGDKDNRYSPVKMPDISRVADVALGFNFGIALKMDGTLYSWGTNASGQLCQGDTDDLNYIMKINSIVNVKAIRVDAQSCMALTNKGELYAWGRNDCGQLGTGDTDNRSSPAKVAGLSDVASFGLGTNHGTALTGDGSLYVWGSNEYGQLGLGDESVAQIETPRKLTGLPAVGYISADIYNTAAIASDGTLYLCGAVHSPDAAEPNKIYAFQPVNNVFCFPTVNTYDVSRFSDVGVSAWFCESVASACEYGLMKGGGDGLFHPDSSITLGESVALAARIHRIYAAGADDFTESSPWYRVYADYALQNGILDTDYPDYTKTATRAEFASILAGALPDGALGVINKIDDGTIPDVPAGEPYSAAVYKLYRAGVLTGSDVSGTFHPEDGIGRSSVAAIVGRMADPGLRKAFTLIEPVPVTSVALSQTSVSLDPGASAYLTAALSPDNATDRTIVWSTSDASVATVSYGKVTAVAGGTAVVTATAAGGASASCTVTVTLVEPTLITLSLTSCTLAEGNYLTLTAAFSPISATDRALVWSSSDPSVATVSGGKITAVSVGTAVITASTSNGLKATCTVKVTAGGNVYALPGQSDGSSTPLTAEEIYSRCAPAIFTLVVYDKNGDPFAQGSGFFITSGGMAVTNCHVIEDAYSFKAYLSDGSSYWVDRVLASDEDKDLAILHVKGSGFKTLPIGDSSAVTGGQTIYAIGTPEGMTSTISDGIVSNPCRLIDGIPSIPFIQITAPISHGSSGGALLNQYGQVIGVTAAFYGDGQNLNLAIPISLIYTLTIK